MNIPFKNKKLFHVIRETAYGAVIALLIVLGAIVVLSAFGIPADLRMLVVQSGSMEPKIRAGSMVFVTPRDEYRENDVITFTNPVDKTSTPITHRIIDIEEEDGITSYITKGDANESPDANPVEENEIIGSVRFTIPFLGYPVAFAKTPMGFILLIVIPATLIIQNEARTAIRETKNVIASRREKAASGGSTK